MKEITKYQSSVTLSASTSFPRNDQSKLTGSSYSLEPRGLSCLLRNKKIQDLFVTKGNGTITQQKIMRDYLFGYGIDVSVTGSAYGGYNTTMQTVEEMTKKVKDFVERSIENEVDILEFENENLKERIAITKDVCLFLKYETDAKKESKMEEENTNDNKNNVELFEMEFINDRNEKYVFKNGLFMFDNETTKLLEIHSLHNDDQLTNNFIVDSRILSGYNEFDIHSKTLEYSNDLYEVKFNPNKVTSYSSSTSTNEPIVKYVTNNELMIFAKGYRQQEHHSFKPIILIYEKEITNHHKQQTQISQIKGYPISQDDMKKLDLAKAYFADTQINLHYIKLELTSLTKESQLMQTALTTKQSWNI